MAVTKRLVNFAFCLLAGLITMPSFAGTLAPDTVDMLYHRFDGGGVLIDGPAVLVRKSIGNQFSFNGQYYVDSVSSASVDVLAKASPYEEERTEYSGGMDFLYEKSVTSMGYVNSTENDFEAKTAFISISQDFFGDLTNLTLGYAQGWDTVRATGNSSFEEEAGRRIFRFGLNQIITKSSQIGFNFETITDEGYLNNPYRFYRFRDGSAKGWDTATEKYPETRTTNAASVRAQYYLPYRAALKFEYRFFTDTWGVEASNWEVGYTHPIGRSWIVETRYRQYSQTKADFYNDLFTSQDQFEYMGRDKELSTFSGTTIGVGVSYEIGRGVIPLIDRIQFNLLMDFMTYEYDDFRLIQKTDIGQVGNEPFYSFDATVTRASVTFEY